MGNKSAKPGQNHFEKLGISSTSTIGSEALDQIWKFYLEKDTLLKREKALRCLREIGEACNVPYDEKKAQELLLSVSPSGSLSREQFEDLFCFNAYEGHKVNLSESVQRKHPKPKKVEAPTNSNTSSATGTTEKSNKAEVVEVIDKNRYKLPDEPQYVDEEIRDDDDPNFAEKLQKKKQNFDIVSPGDFVVRLLRIAAEEVGPYVPFCPDDDDSKELAELKKWKCLNVLRAIGWNLGKVDTILDDQEKTLKKAGVLEEPKTEKNKVGEQFKCSVCSCDSPWKETSALECGHRFCNECWSGSIDNTLSTYSWETLFSHFTCMQRGCELAILGNLVQANVNDAQWTHYCKMLARSFSEANATTYSICPNDRCNKVAISKHSNTSNVVNCLCGQSYCFKCTLAPHIPASCKDLEKWKAKNSDDEMTVNFIKATTTICPQCGNALDRYTACNHITCKCGCRFCFICKKVPWCGAYDCSSYKSVEEAQAKNKTQFANGYQTASDWLVAHERFVAFDKKYAENKNGAEYAETKLTESLKQKALQYYELKPGGNPQFMSLGVQTLVKAYRVLQYTLVWGFFNIPAKICPQKQIFEMQIKSYETNIKELRDMLETQTAAMDHLKTKRLYTLLQDNLIKQIEDSDDLMSLFSSKQTASIGPTTLGRWTCKKCNYSNHPTEQEKACGHCGAAREQVASTWFT